MAQKTTLTQPILNVIAHYKKRLQAARVPVEKLIVFGSQVRGKTREGSDIDVCVVSPLFGRDRQAERVKLMRLRDTITIDIEPHPYNSIELSNRWDSLAQEILKYGVRT